MSKQVFRVKIFGKEYPLSGDLDPELVDEVVELVNTKMQDTAKEMPLGSFQKVAVLSCLNLALELTLLKKESSQADPEVETKIQGLIEIIEQLQSQIPVQS